MNILMWLLVAFAVWTIGFLAVVEYLLHRHIMHRPHQSPFLWEAFHTHAVLHHQDARNDLNIDAEPVYNLLLGSPVIALVLGVGWLTGDPRRSWPPRDRRPDRRVLAALDWPAPVDARGRRPVGLAPPRLRGAPRPPPRPPPACGAQLRDRVRVVDGSDLRHTHVTLKLAGERLAAVERAAVLATSPVLAGIPTWARRPRTRSGSSA